MGQIVSLLFFCMDVFGIKYLMKIDVIKQKKKQKKTNNNNKKKHKPNLLEGVLSLYWGDCIFYAPSTLRKDKV